MSKAGDGAGQEKCKHFERRIQRGGAEDRGCASRLDRPFSLAPHRAHSLSLPQNSARVTSIVGLSLWRLVHPCAEARGKKLHPGRTAVHRVRAAGNRGSPRHGPYPLSVAGEAQRYVRSPSRMQARQRPTFCTDRPEHRPQRIHEGGRRSNLPSRAPTWRS